MTVSSMLFLLAPTLLSLWAVYSVVKAYWRLRNFAGPSVAAWTDLYFVWLSTTGRQHVILGELVDKYGKGSGFCSHGVDG